MTDDVSAATFNYGSDARIAGTPLESFPYPNSTHEQRQWFSGWIHAHTYWGKDAKRGMQVKRIPKVDFGCHAEKFLQEKVKA